MQHVVLVDHDGGAGVEDEPVAQAVAGEAHRHALERDRPERHGIAGGLALDPGHGVTAQEHLGEHGAQPERAAQARVGADAQQVSGGVVEARLAVAVVQLAVGLERQHRGREGDDRDAAIDRGVAHGGGGRDRAGEPAGEEGVPGLRVGGEEGGGGFDFGLNARPGGRAG
ncbi:hypothetical protein NS230_22705 [Methylobacterium indicum]|nr:hypothetical protein NS230_22705 [Methylobacterium indicum]